MINPETSRRSFLGRLLGGTLLAGAASIIGTIAAYLFAPGEVRSSLGPQRVKVAKAADIPLGSGKLTLVNEEPVWVVHLAQGFVAMSAVCTHKGCTTKWDDKRRLFNCPCHDGRFDERGNVVAGLPRRPLTHFHVALVGDDVYASRGQERRI
ncbi:MAG TPA: Rieske (2Fe-2S) protein [Candidatus Binatia bacterium]|nr:Rieske (2Fe-2S) protein [Candidatus Binatia bacterium]